MTAAVHQPDDPGAPQYIMVQQAPGNGHKRSLDSVVQALLPVGVAALIGVVWMLSLNNVRLEATVGKQGEDIAELTTAVKELTIEVRGLREARLITKREGG